MVVAGETLAELLPGIDRVTREAGELVAAHICKHDGQIVDHHVGVAFGRLNSGGIDLQPLQWVGLAIILVDIRKLDTP